MDILDLEIEIEFWKAMLLHLYAHRKETTDPQEKLKIEFMEKVTMFKKDALIDLRNKKLDKL
jgi:hypothetical protein